MLEIKVHNIFMQKKCNDDMEEQPIPEQFSSVLKRKEDGTVDHLETEVSDLYA